MGVRVLVSGVACGLMLVSLPGCLVSIDSDVSTYGTRVPDSSLRQVVVGESTRDDVRLIVGEPDMVTALDDGGELWSWNYTRRENSEGRVFLLLSVDDADEDHERTSIRFDSRGVVTSKWQSDD